MPCVRRSHNHHWPSWDLSAIDFISKERTFLGNSENPMYLYRASQVVQWYRIRLPMQEKQAPSLGQEDPLEKEMAIHPSIHAWEVPWIEEPGRPTVPGAPKSWT